MRILLATNYQPPHMGGIEFAGASLKRCWEEAGHAVTWLTSDVPRGARRSGDGNVRLPAFNGLESLLEVNTPVVSPTSYGTVCSLVSNHDVVNVHSLAPGVSSMALRCAIGRRRPTVVTQHVGVIKLRSRVLNALQERMLIRKAEWAMRGGALLTFVGKAVRDWFLSKAIIPEDRVFMTPAGIDAADYHLVTTEERWGFRTKWGLNGGDFGVLFVGRFYEKKGLPLIREAARILSDVKFTLVGKGPLQVSGWGLPNVRIIDFVSNAELRELYGAHDLFIMPSHGEGWPAVVPQAMACGLPCLISEETFQGYDRDAQMFLTCERSPESLGRNIRNARTRMRAPLDDRGTVSRYALEHWDWRRTAAVYLDLFGRAMCGTPATGTLPGC